MSKRYSINACADHSDLDRRRFLAQSLSGLAAASTIPAAGVDRVHFVFYKNRDLGNDGVWDVWQVVSPNMVWFFRGSPHVHTWVNLAATTS